MKNFEKHPLNIVFDWNPPSGPYQRISKEQAQSWSEKGFFVLDSVAEWLGRGPQNLIRRFESARCLF